SSAWSGAGALAPEPSECLQQSRAELRREILCRDRPSDPDRRAHLLQAVRAAGQMRVERHPQRRVHGALEIIGDDLDDLLARKVSGRCAHAFSRYCSNAARTFARARWSSTRWFVSESP